MYLVSVFRSSAAILSLFVNLFVKLLLFSGVIYYFSANAYIAFTNIIGRRIFRGITLGMVEDNPTTWNTARIGAVLESQTHYRTVNF